METPQEKLLRLEAEYRLWKANNDASPSRVYSSQVAWASMALQRQREVVAAQARLMEKLSGA